MNDAITKKFLQVAGGLFLLAAASALVWQMTGPSWFKNIRAEVTSQPYARTVTVNGEGEVTSKPDMAVVSLSVVAQAATVSAVTQQGNAQMSKVIAAVKGLGVSEDDVQTTQYNLYPRYRYPENGAPQLSGYQLDQSLNVKVRDLTKVEEVLDGGVSAGANQVGGISFEIDDDSAQRNEAREDAFADAREKAEAMAAAAGVRLGRVVTFSEGFDGGPQPPMPFGRGGDLVMAESSAMMVDVEPGSQETKITVSVTYEIE